MYKGSRKTFVKGEYMRSWWVKTASIDNKDDGYAFIKGELWPSWWVNIISVNYKDGGHALSGVICSLRNAWRLDPSIMKMTVTPLSRVGKPLWSVKITSTNNKEGVVLAPHAFIKGDFCLHGLWRLNPSIAKSYSFIKIQPKKNPSLRERRWRRWRRLHQDRFWSSCVKIKSVDYRDAMIEEGGYRNKSGIFKILVARIGHG